MNTTNLTQTLSTLFGELMDGTSPSGGYMLNANDVGLLRSIDKISATDASAVVDGGSSIAAHVDHIAYGIGLMNRWAAGENPWKDADWSASWKHTKVSDDGWEKLRGKLADESHQWLGAIKQPRELSETELTGMIGSIAHLAYHLGAIRQMDRKICGPKARD
jgi:hypothetical protein